MPTTEQTAKDEGSSRAAARPIAPVQAGPTATHTPGPWSTAKWGNGSSVDGTTNVISERAVVVIAADVCEDDARLIAAAPAMLMMLQRELADLREQAETGLCSRSRDQRIDDMAAAIKRATEGR